MSPNTNMRSLTLLSLVTLATAYSDFHLPHVLANQPNGVAEGQVNFYTFLFNVTSTNTSPPQSNYCTPGPWADNHSPCGDSCVPYSTYVPSGVWQICYTDDTLTEKGSFSFRLSPYFGVGNITIELRQTVPGFSGTGLTLQTDPYRITNASAAVFGCTIVGDEAASFGEHASGNCQTPAETKGFFVPVADAF